MSFLPLISTRHFGLLILRDLPPARIVAVRDKSEHNCAKITYYSAEVSVYFS